MHKLCAGLGNCVLGHIHDQDVVQATQTKPTPWTNAIAYHRIRPPARHASSPKLGSFGPKTWSRDVTAAWTKALRCCDFSRSSEGVSQAPRMPTSPPGPPSELLNSLCLKVRHPSLFHLVGTHLEPASMCLSLPVQREHSSLVLEVKQRSVHGF